MFIIIGIQKAFFFTIIVYYTLTQQILHKKYLLKDKNPTIVTYI